MADAIRSIGVTEVTSYGVAAHQFWDALLKFDGADNANLQSKIA
jgi:hypothetical protein